MDETSVTQSILNMFEGAETATAVFRLNVGVSRETYRTLFGTQSPRPGPDGVVDTDHDLPLWTN
jgi:hypothetical protein